MHGGTTACILCVSQSYLLLRLQGGILLCSYCCPRGTDMSKLPALTRVKLLGLLGKTFVREIRLDITTPTEAIQALAAQFPEFLKFLEESSDKGIEYRVLSIKDKTYREIYEEELSMSISGDTLVISPVLVHSGGSPIFRTILGVGLIGAAFMTGGVSLLGMSISSTTMGLMGAALVLGGVSQMLAPNPIKDKDKDKKDNKTLAALNNTAVQGRAVPLIYGQTMHTGLIPISQSVTNEVLVGDAVEAITNPEHRRVTQAKLSYRAVPLDNYNYLTHPRLQTPLGVEYLSCNDIYVGCAVWKDNFNRLSVELRFNNTTEGLSMAARYAIQRLMIYSGMPGLRGANRVDIWAGNSATGQIGLGAYALTPNAYTNLDLSGLPQYKTPYHVFTLHFTNNEPHVPYVVVGELTVFGTLGLINDLHYHHL